MKFIVERNFLVRTREEIEISPESFLHCANIMELNDEVEDYISNRCTHPSHPNLEYSEELGCRYSDNWPFENTESFYLKWQELRELQKEKSH